MIAESDAGQRQNARMTEIGHQQTFGQELAHVSAAKLQSLDRHRHRSVVGRPIRPLVDDAEIPFADQRLDVDFVHSDQPFPRHQILQTLVFGARRKDQMSVLQRRRLPVPFVIIRVAGQQDPVGAIVSRQQIQTRFVGLSSTITKPNDQRRNDGQRQRKNDGGDQRDLRPFAQWRADDRRRVQIDVRQIHFRQIRRINVAVSRDPQQNRTNVRRSCWI